LIRTIWFAAICLAGVAGLLAAKFTPFASAEETVPDPVPMTVGLGDDTLTKSDKLTLAYVLPESAPDWPTQAIRREEPADNAKTPFSQPLVSQPLAPPLAASHLNRRVVVLPRPRPKIRLAKISHPPKLVVEAKTCSQPDSLGGLLLSFSGQPHCD
jgi:hypothetical protein